MERKFQPNQLLLAAMVLGILTSISSVILPYWGSISGEFSVGILHPIVTTNARWILPISLLGAGFSFSAQKNVSSVRAERDAKSARACFAVVCLLATWDLVDYGTQSGLGLLIGFAAAMGASFLTYKATLQISEGPQQSGSGAADDSGR